jgi:hypothetical protein
MPLWIVAVALGSIAITALLTWILWRLNEPLHRRPPSDVVDGTGDAGGGDGGK